MEQGIDDILTQWPKERSSLIPILQRVQERLGYLPEEAIRQVAQYLRLTPNQVFGVLTFYAQFRLTPQGRHLVRVCRGTACHVRGGASIRRTVERLLQVSPDETTPDRKFTYETVACLGACALAPVMVLNGVVHGETTPDKARLLLDAV